MSAPAVAPAAPRATTVQPVTRNQEATVYVGNLDERVNEAILWELMLQAGPVVHIHIPRDRISQAHQGYGFVEFQAEPDADYAARVMNQVRLYGKPIRVNRATVGGGGAADRKALQDIGANLFIGNLAPEVDERMLADCFATFGVPILGGPKVARDGETGQSRGYGFVSYDSFEASDAAIEGMNGQFLCNRPITVNYAFKKDGRGERHGSLAERMLAAQSRKSAITANANANATTNTMINPSTYPQGMIVQGMIGVTQPQQQPQQQSSQSTVQMPYPPYAYYPQQQQQIPIQYAHYPPPPPPQ